MRVLTYILEFLELFVSPKIQILYVLLLFVVRVTNTSAQCPSGQTGGNFISSFSLTACARFYALRIDRRSFVSVANRNAVATGTLPTYIATGGPKGSGYLSFSRANLQFINGGARAFSVSTNGGFTIIAWARFTGTVQTYERIVELNGPTAKHEFSLTRYTTNNQLNVYIGSTTAGSLFQLQTPVNVITQNVWFSVVVRGQLLTKTFTIWVNNKPEASYTHAIFMADKSLTTTYIARNADESRNMNGDIAGVFIVDEYLTDAAVTSITDNMASGLDLTHTTCPSGSSCTPCVPGTYKDVTGSASCTNCAAGTYSTIPGGKVQATCLACPTGSISPEASTSSAACIGAPCNAGYTGPSGGPCTECFYGTYKTTTGSATCQNCPVNSYTTTTGNSALTACLCDEGYTGPDGGICSACNANWYKPTRGSAQCTQCPVYTTSPIGSAWNTRCNCIVGYTGPNGGPCTACAAGTYKNIVGISTCLICPDGTTSPAGSTSSAACEFSGFLDCDPGYTGPTNGTCTPCAPGTFKNTQGSTACTACAAATFSNTSAATACTACPVYASSPPGSSSANTCTCQIGYGIQ
jgi:hypothetical protein